jgi:hypothetical protein
MMWAGQPANEELEARRARFDLRSRREPAMSCISATAGGEDQPDLLGWIERSPPSRPAVPAYEIEVDQSQRIPLASESRDRRGARGGLVLVVVAGSIALAAIGIASGYFFLGPTASSTSPPQSPDRPAGIADSTKGDRLPIRHTIVRETERTAPAKSPHGPNQHTSTTIARRKPSPAVVSPAPSAGNHATAEQPPPISPADTAAKPYTEARLTPVPETRPTTIDGWTLREVVDGTAVLEGPGGVWRARRGDTVPGAGKVIGILRWGNRLIVATSRGLISTP